MRQIVLLAALVFATTVAAANAQDATAPDQQSPPPSERQPVMPLSGPISGGVYHQPTRAEIEQRERDNRAAQQRSQQETKEVDQLYNQLIHPDQSADVPK
jgi:hypothetical protein